MNGIFGSWTRASRLTLIVALTGTGICLPTIAQSSPGIPPEIGRASCRERV